jgi:ABC-2 type transport system permease protein
MEIKRILAIFLRQMFLIKSNPVRFVSIFLWLVLDIIQWGFISKYLGTFGKATFGLVTVLLGAIILWEFMTRIQQGIMTTFLEDIWTQNFMNFFASPLKIKEYLAGLVATSMTTGLAGFLIMILLAGLAFGYNFFILGFYLLPFILALFIFGVAMGLFVTAMIFRLGPAAEWLGWPIPFVLSVFSGVFYPVSTLPEVLRVLAKFLPPSYIFESVRAVIARTDISSLGTNLFWGFLLAIIYLFIAYRFFIRVYRHNLKTGSISRFNAEEL